MCEICGDYERLIASDLGMQARRLNVKQKKDKDTQLALFELTEEDRLEQLKAEDPYYAGGYAPEEGSNE